VGFFHPPSGRLVQNNSIARRPHILDHRLAPQIAEVIHLQPCDPQ
jgi:hypothetical protein